MSQQAQRYQRKPRSGEPYIDKPHTLSRKARRRAKSALMFLCLAFPAERLV